MSQETIRQAFPDKATPLVSYGIPFTESCAKHVQKLKASRVYLIAGKSLTKNTSFTSDLQKALGASLAKTRVGMTPHTLMSEVLEIVEECRTVNADCIVTLGGGSLSDAAKVITFALANNVKTQVELVKLPHLGGKSSNFSTDNNINAHAPTVPIICIPTTLSGGEYSTYAGVTDHLTGEKVQFCPPIASPDVIILSGELACSTPLDVWLQSGMRAVDHCIETLASLKSTPEVDEFVTKSLKCLIPGLLNAKANFGMEDGKAQEIKAREECQIGVMWAMIFLHRKVACGASHGIGHMLGPMFHVGHGETSCILLPAACRFNAIHGGKEILSRQQLMRDALWSVGEARKRYEREGLNEENARVDQLLDVVIRELGLKRRLSEVGVVERKDLERLAEASLRDPFLITNAVPITTKEQVLEILEMSA
ncbi:putative Fe-containing alcohol dehydrogenase [Mollisia scopiformis]|uniref:Putative Fe-containing alcohol dehydrogenase n=1 Tax=Mollisia scopiformis TaxID=149040 RepID=A0A194X4I4_MOLSC|nr:putative Fe-containing alcohol dehydrogenase [Mollisia scopiformis]KUJ15093.1 putative Fe-containing alcohol dehydrogenase [Mollisia scopiformis]